MYGKINYYIKNNKFPIVICILLFCISACKHDYIIGGKGTDINQYKSLTTYEYLKNNANTFDTLIQLIDAAGLEKDINAEGTTFFALTNTSIYQYLSKRTIDMQNNIDANSKFTLDSLLFYIKTNIHGTADSLKMYLINQPLSYDALTAQGTKYATDLTNDTAIVSYEYTTIGQNKIISTVPRVVYYTHLWTSYTMPADSTISSISSDEGTREIVQTSGIYTKNGVVQVLNKQSVLFFYGQNPN